MIRRGPASGRFLPRLTAEAVPLLAIEPRNPAAVALGRHSARVVGERDRSRRIDAMNALRRELGLPEWRANRG